MAGHSAVTIGLLIAAWVVKVIIIGVFMYMYKRFRRREAELQAAELERLQQQANSPYPALGKPTPAHVVAGLPVVHYHLLAQEHGSYIKGPLASPGLPGTPEQQQQQQQIPGKQGNQQQEQAGQKDVHQRQVLQLHASAGAPVKDTTSDTAAAAADDITPLPPDALVVTILDADEAVMRSSSSSGSSSSTGACPNQEAPITTTSDSSSSSSRRSSLDSEGHDQCSICFSCYGAKDAVMVLPCGHYYHQSCVATWLTRDCTCPLCKRYVYRLDPHQVAAAGDTEEVAGSPDHQQQDQHQQQQAVGAPVTAAGQQSGGNSSNGGNRGEEGPRRGLAATAATFTQQLRASGAGMLGIVVH